MLFTVPPIPKRTTKYGSLLSVSSVNNTESLHSLSSDSEGATSPRKKHLIPSRSMTNVKQTEVNNTPRRSLLSHHSKSLTNIAENIDNNVPAKIPAVSSTSSSGILQVFAAYDTGLASGTSLKLHVTPRTTAREVVDLVVKQLNMAVVLKGKDGPIYPADKLKNFCLVAVIGARERCLRDDFKPLQLQNPWRKGRLYVRQKHDVLAALEHSSKHSAII